MVDSSTTRYLTLQQKRAIIIGINLGRRLQQELPPIADDYRARMFVEKGRENSSWVLNNLLKFDQYQKDRADRKEITAATIRNYIKSIKLFCEMADIRIPWKKITRGLPKGRKYADDTIPTLEEIRKLVEYPDKRIKAIVYTMASSRIRLGAWDRGKRKSRRLGRRIKMKRNNHHQKKQWHPRN